MKARLLLLLLVAVVVAVGACSSFEEPTDTVQQGICADNASCSPNGLSCTDAQGSNFVCVGGQYDPNPDACVLGGSCSNPTSVCQDACGQGLFCGGDSTYHDLPGNMACNPTTSSSTAVSTSVTTGTTTSSSTASSTSASSTTGSGMGGAGGAPGNTCVSDNLRTDCSAFNEGDMVCNGELTCHCTVWVLTDNVPLFNCATTSASSSASSSSSSSTSSASSSSATSSSSSSGSTTSSSSAATTSSSSMMSTGTGTPPYLCYEGNTCSPDSTSKFDSICVDVTNGDEFLRCCGGALIASSINSLCPSGTTTSTSASGSTGTGMGGAGSTSSATTGSTTSTSSSSASTSSSTSSSSSASSSSSSTGSGMPGMGNMCVHITPTSWMGANQFVLDSHTVTMTAQGADYVADVTAPSGSQVPFWIHALLNGANAYWPFDVCAYSGDYCATNGGPFCVNSVGHVWVTSGSCSSGGTVIWDSNTGSRKNAAPGEPAGWVDNNDGLGVCTSNAVVIAP